MLSLKCSLTGGKDAEKWSRGRGLREGKETGRKRERATEKDREEGSDLPLSRNFRSRIDAVAKRAQISLATSRWTEESNRLIATVRNDMLYIRMPWMLTPSYIAEGRPWRYHVLCSGHKTSPEPHYETVTER